MKRQKVIVSLLTIPVLAALVAWGGSHLGQTYNDVPIFAIGVVLAFAINWIAFIPATLLKSEMFFDLTGSLTYISVILLTIYLTRNTGLRSQLLAALVIIWAVRLGSFLLNRILQDGHDDRFEQIKPDFLRFLNVWTLQALWVTITSAAALIVITSKVQLELGYFAYVGLAIWIIGFLLEVVADFQKRKFKRDPANKGKFIQSGLWSKSRHPNYFGEILLWIGIFIIALPVLQGWQWIAVISPIFVWLLLTKVSGLPMLEAKSNKKWGGQKDYENYKSNTPILIPKLF